MLHNQIRALLYDTILQASRRWVILGLFILATLVILFFSLAVSVQRGSVDTDEIEVTWLIGSKTTSMSAEDLAQGMILFVLGTNTFLGLFFFTLAFAGFIPETLQKGTADLLLSKPVSRTVVALSKIAGIALIGITLTCYFFFGSLLVVWIKTGYYPAEAIVPFLLSAVLVLPVIPIIVFFGTLLRSASTSVMAVVGMYFLTLATEAASTVHFKFDIAGIGAILKGLYYALPQFPAMQKQIMEIAQGWERGRAGFTKLDWDPFIQSMIVGIVFCVLTVVVMRRKDFTS